MSFMVVGTLGKPHNKGKVGKGGGLSAFARLQPGIPAGERPQGRNSG